MAKQYNHKEIESKWQKRWEESQAFKAPEDSSKKKSYLLIEFPYPSGDGLHVGHVRSWTAMDVVARKRRAQGENVLYPIGWDAFGLPAENYAIKTGIHPKITTKENTDNFRRQIKSIGLSFDWSREVNTTDPDYYKWTQWIFLQLFKKGLAYKAKIPVNWCPKDKIVLANEEVVDGCCERCGTPVEKREKEQWMLAITKYAQRLYDDLDTVNYIERAKVQQKNWIGPSEGAEIEFGIKNSELRIKVFTTRPDTIFGATYVVLAPEHSLVASLANRASNKDEILRYIEGFANKTDLERQEGQKDKTGVEINGIKAINPATKEEIPLYVADYVLGGYGTGAIMAVPAHDERDGEFAQKFGLPIREVIAPDRTDVNNPPRRDKKTVERRSVYSLVRRKSDGKYLLLKWKHTSWLTFIIGGVEDGEDLLEAAIREIQEETGYQNLRLVRQLGDVYANYFASHKDENRKAHFTGLLLELVNEEQKNISDDEKQKHEPIWMTLEEASANAIGVEPPIFIPRLEAEGWTYTGDGVLINSGKFSGLESGEAKRKITETVGGTLVKTFHLRDWVFSRQRYWGEPIPMIHCKQCGWQPVLEKDLPVKLPEVEKYQPTDTGESPLAGMRDWVETTCPKCNGAAERETDVMPNWAGSSWYYLRYCDPNNDQTFASREKLDYWTPVDWYNGGMEHTVLHLLYSRFWHKFLFDIGVVPSAEPYMKRTSHGLILAEGGEKMSKSKGNTVSPDTIVETYGADSLRLYEMFLGPFDQPVAWNTSAIVGVRRFLERVWKLKVGDGDASTLLDVILNQTIKKVTEDIENLKMNTAVSSLMILLNAMEAEPVVPKAAYKSFLQLLAPFAPHMAAELWEQIGESGLIYQASWPVADESKLVASKVPVAVQVNGKLRTTLELPVDMAEEEAIEAARSDQNVRKWLALGKEVKAVYVPGKVINFVIEQS